MKKRRFRFHRTADTTKGGGNEKAHADKAHIQQTAHDGVKWLKDGLKFAEAAHGTILNDEEYQMALDDNAKWTKLIEAKAAANA